MKIGSYSEITGTAFDIFVKDDLIYIADGPDGLEMIQLTVKENPTTKRATGFSIILILFVFIPIILDNKGKFR